MSKGTANPFLALKGINILSGFFFLVKIPKDKLLCQKRSAVSVI